MDCRLLVALAGIGATLVALPAAAQAQLTLKRCSRTSAYRCGRVVVPLDRTGAIPGSVRLAVRVREPKTSATNGAILMLAGGPGQAAVPFIDVVPRVLGSIADSNRVIAFDQRGTGASGRLSCRALRRLRLTSAAIARCAAELGPRRAAYTTAASVEDIDAVRAALGVDRLTILGVSYGTKVALDYASAHPDRVDRLILDSTLDPAAPDPFATASFAALPRVLRTLCAGSCPFTRDAGADLEALAARLQGGALRETWFDARGRARAARVTGTELLSVAAAIDMDPFAAAMVPGAVRNALAGDPAPLISLVRVGAGAESLSGGDSNAVLIATNCEDMAPVWPVGTPIAQRSAHIAGALAALPPTTFGGFGAKVANHESVPEVCRTWPESPIAQPAPTTPQVPTLILSGTLDVRTPLEVAERLAARLPNARLVRVAGVGHSVLTSDVTGCATASAAAFMAGQRVGDCTKGRPLLGVLAPAPTRLADVRPIGALHGTVGRVAAAVSLTVTAITLQAVVTGGEDGFGGLRGGYLSVAPDGRTARLHRYSYVPGVDLSGSSRGTLTVRGPRGVRGRVRVTADNRVRGTIAGHRIDLAVADPLDDALAELMRAAAGDGASAILEPWPTAGATTTSSSSARPASPAR